MIKLWLSRGTSTSIREQLCSQLILGILSGRLLPGERLPSVRTLARRLDLHANTISAAYQELETLGWLTKRHGSGVFVRALPASDNGGNLQSFVRSCYEEGMAHGWSRASLAAAFADSTELVEARRLLVVDPDFAFAQILAAEIGAAIHQPLPFADSRQARQLLTPDTLALISELHVRSIAETLGPVTTRTIRLQAMQDVLAMQTRPATEVLIAVVSRSTAILRWAATLLSALGYPADSTLFRNPAEPNWQDGLTACDIIAADVVAASELPPTITPIVFKVVSEAFLVEMNQSFNTRPSPSAGLAFS